MLQAGGRRLVPGLTFREQPTREHGCGQGTQELGDNESRYVDWPDAGEGVREPACNRHRRVRKARGAGEPVGGGDVETHAPGPGPGAPAVAPDRAGTSRIRP